MDDNFVVEDALHNVNRLDMLIGLVRWLAPWSHFQPPSSSVVHITTTCKHNESLLRLADILLPCRIMKPR
jgi:hypothetical protein